MDECCSINCIGTGFYLGYNAKPEDPTLGGFSEKMQEVETYFVNTIDFEIKELEKTRTLDTEKIIEKALERIEKLEDDYKILLKN